MPLNNLTGFKKVSINLNNNFLEYGGLTFTRIGNCILVTGCFKTHKGLKIPNVIPIWARPKQQVNITGIHQNAYQNWILGDNSITLFPDLSIQFSNESDNLIVPVVHPVIYKTTE